MIPAEAITVVIPTSPLVVHPSTEIIDEIYTQTRKQLPDSHILILVDGVHPEEEYLRERYEEFLDNLAHRWHDWTRTSIQYFDEWAHQSGMLSSIFFGVQFSYRVKTPLVFWSEHDIPLNNEYIDWQGIVDTLLEGEIGAIRFELTGDPPKKIEVRGHITPHGIPLVLSTQYVNWPQVFRLDYLKEFVAAFGTSKTYLECAEFDDVVSRLWSKWKYGIYSPDPIIRCYHTDGRCRGTQNLGKPFVEINGLRRNAYSTPYKPAEGI